MASADDLVSSSGKKAGLNILTKAVSRDTGGARRPRCIATLAMALGLGLASPAYGFELFGLCLFGDCNAQDTSDGLIDPRPYDVDVRVSINGAGDRALEKSVKNASLLWLERKKPAAGSAGLLTRAKADYKRILAALYNDARYSGEISIRWRGREVADIPAGTELPDNALFEISVDAGTQYRFGTAEIDNQAPPATNRRDRVAAPADEGFASGNIAYAQTVKTAGRLAVDAWREQGYAKAGIAGQSVTARHESRELNARLSVEPGQRAYYGPVTVEGTERMHAPFVARQTGLIEGREYDPDDLKRADARLQRLGVFRAASLKEAQKIQPGGALPFTLTVQERKLRRIGVGGTFSTVDGAGAEAFWLHRNLFGRAERIRFDARVSGIGTSTDFKRYDYYFGSALTLPGRFTPDTDITIKAFGEREVLDLYAKTRVAGSVMAEHFYDEYITFRGGVFASYGEYDDVFGVRRFGVAGGELGATYDTRNSELDPTNGIFVDIGARPFYEWEFGNAIGRVEGEARAYLGLGPEERTVLAARLKVGSIAGAPIMQIPQDELFLAGGGNSVRGYSYRSIGVPVTGGTSGGRSLFEGSFEVRQKITDAIGVVGFVDVGQVNSTALPNFSGTIRTGAGFGLRYNTGLGPIRLDLAFPLNPQAGDPRFAVYAGIGQAF
jgi:translocation and assembly module TamA